MCWDLLRGAGFSQPDNIKLAGISAILNDETKYTPATGTLQLKQAICQRLEADCGVHYEPSQIIVSSGAKHCLYIILRALVNPGDEVIIPTPAWVSYNEMTKIAGGIPVFIPCPEADHFKLTPEKLEAAITDRTKCIMFNNPSNPTGMVYTKEELVALADICIKHDLYIIADEIYYKLLYDGVEFTSIASLGEAVKEHTHFGQRRLQKLCYDWLADWLSSRRRPADQSDGSLPEPFHRQPLCAGAGPL